MSFEIGVETTATLETLVVAAYVFADELRTPRRLGRPPVVSDEELIALAVGQAITAPTGSSWA